MMKSLYFFAFIGLFFVSCASKKKLSWLDKNYTNEEILAALNNHNHDFTWFHGKGTAQVRTSLASQNVSMVMRIQKDSAVWMQVKKFEIEAARILITPREYTLLNRLESTYQTSSLGKIKDMVGFPIEYPEIQEWLFGNIILPQTDTSEIIRGEENILVHFLSGEWDINYVLHKSNLTLHKAEIKDKQGRVLTIHYENYKKLKNGMFLAHTRAISFPEEPGVTGVVKLEFSEMEVNVPKELKFVIPSHYRESEY